MQEVRWSNKIIEDIKKIWRGEIFFAPGPRMTAGTAILIRPGMPHNVTCAHEGDEGRLVVVDLDTM